MRRKLINELVNLCRITENELQDNNSEILKDQVITVIDAIKLCKKERELFADLCYTEGL
jgi:hypothetical protein